MMGCLLAFQTVRSVENERIGNITIIAWQIEEKREQRAPVARLQRGDTINGRVSDTEMFPTTGFAKVIPGVDLLNSGGVT